MPRPAKTDRAWLRQPRVLAAALAVAAFVVFWPSLNCEFVNLDDPDYVLNNTHVKRGLSLDGVKWAATQFAYGNWHPLTWLSLQLDATLWRTPDGRAPDPWGFHLTNALLHAASAAVLFLALLALTGARWRSAAVAALFAVHPLRVESVAWIAERKDVLSVFFGLLALWAYAAYARRPSVRRYLLVAAPFALSLLAKPMLVTLPCLLLVLDWWPLQRAAAPRADRPAGGTGIQLDTPPSTASGWMRLVLEKLPLFALVVLSSVVTYLAQGSGGAVQSLEHISPADRLQNAAIGYAFYLVKTAWPVGLAVFYPHRSYAWGAGLAPATVAAAAVLLAAITVAAWVLRKRAPYLLAGWLWYLGTLVPVIGIVQIGDQSYADRYSYFPQIGVLVAVCWGVADCTLRRPRLAVAAAAVAVVLLAAQTRQQLTYWQESEALWRHDLAVVGPNPLALIDLGIALDAKNRRDEADGYLRHALELVPNAVLPHINRGNLLFRERRLQESVDEFRKALELQPNFPEPRAQLGEVLLRQGKLDEATAELEKTIEIAPWLSAAHCNLGLVELQRRDFAKAADHFREAIRLQDDSAEAHSGLGWALFSLGKQTDGLAELRTAVDLNPGFGEGHLFLAYALEKTQDYAGAEEHYARAWRIDPGLAQGWFGYAKAMVRRRRWDDAIECFERAYRLDPTIPDCLALRDKTRAMRDAPAQGLPRATP